MKYTIESRYSETELPDKLGRWARIVYANGLQIAWITKNILHGKSSYYIRDFFPSLKNDDPLYSIIEYKEYDEIIKEVKKRFEDFLLRMNEATKN